jgi:thiol-disulfide isomerase/thioredoxin
MKPNRKTKLLALVFAALAVLWSGMAGAQANSVRAPRIRTDGAEPGEWTHDWDAATAAARETGMPVFVNFTGSDWCPWCKILERQVFSQPEWISWARRNVYLVHLDFPNDKSLVPEKYAGRNRELARRYGVGGYPTCYLLDPATLKPLGRFGASRDATPASFIAEVSAAMSGAAGAAGSAAGPAAAPPPPQGAAGGPTFEIAGGVLRRTRPNGAETVDVPGTVKRIEYGSFVGADGVRAVRLPHGLVEIGNRSFENCRSLERVSIPASVTKIGPGAFGVCPRLSELEIEPGSKFEFRNGILYDTQEKAVLFALPRTRHVAWPEGARTIAEYAFRMCNELEEAVIPDSVAKIDRLAFFQCDRLARVRLPASLEVLEDSAIAFCPSLERVEIAPGNPLYTVSGNLLFADGGKTLVCGFGPLDEIRIPDEVAKIAPRALAENRTLRKVFVPDTVSDIGYDAFSHCPELEELRLPVNVAKCADNIASQCPKLRDLVLPEGIEELRFTYWGCKSLETLRIPSSVKTVGQQAIQGCDGLAEIVFPEGIRVFLGNGIVSDCANLARIVLPSTVETIQGWNVFGKNPKLETIDVSPENPFFRSEDGVLFDKEMTRLVQCPGAKAGIYEIPSSVVEIAPFAFSGCRNLAEIRIPGSVKTIGDRAFADCPAKTVRDSAE